MVVDGVVCVADAEDTSYGDLVSFHLVDVGDVVRGLHRVPL